MKHQRFSSIVLIILLVFIGLGLWWFMRPASLATPSQEQIALAPKPILPIPALFVLPVQVVALRATPTPESVTIANLPVSGNAAPASDDPHSDLKTAIPDLVRLKQSGDLVGVYTSYYPPDSLDPKTIKTLQDLQDRIAKDTPGNLKEQMQLLQQNNIIAQDYEALENQIPTYNETGDEATYMLTVHLVPTPSSIPLTFIKINGKWYLKPRAPDGVLYTADANGNFKTPVPSDN